MIALLQYVPIIHARTRWCSRLAKGLSVEDRHIPDRQEKKDMRHKQETYTVAWPCW